MKEICDLRCYVAIGKGEYMDTSIWKHWRYCKEGKCEETFCNWHDLYVGVKHNNIRNATVEKTIFGKDKVRFSWGSFSYPPFYNDRAHFQNCSCEVGCRTC